jgi:hypothetical protein
MRHTNVENAVPCRQRRCSKIDSHAQQLLAVHALACLVNPRSLLTVVPNRTHYFGRIRNGGAWGRFYIHAIGIILVKHIVFSLESFLAIQALGAGATCVSNAGSHVVRLLGRDEHDRIIKGIIV